jgi:hypothetical protein
MAGSGAVWVGVADVKPKLGERLWVMWGGGFNATYRGREKKDAEPLERGEVSGDFAFIESTLEEFDGNNLWVE